MKNGSRLGCILAGINLLLVTQGTTLPTSLTTSSRPFNHISSLVKYLPSQPEIQSLPSQVLESLPHSSFQSLPYSSFQSLHSLPSSSLPVFFSSASHNYRPTDLEDNNAVHYNQAVHYIPVYLMNSKPVRDQEEGQRLEDRSVVVLLLYRISCFVIYTYI